MVKISQGRVRDKGILLKSLKLVDKNKLLDCAQCTTIVSWWCALFREELLGFYTLSVYPLLSHFYHTHTLNLQTLTMAACR